MAEKPVITDPELLMLTGNKESGYNYRERRHDQWDENYELYRDKVIVNRLEQRQSVNLPLMKQTIRTLLKDVDDMPVLFFENLDNNKDAEIFKNEYWKWTVEYNHMEIQDIVDKRQVFLFGRSFDQWQILSGKIKQTITDPMHILVSRYTDPVDINTSRFLIHTHIFMPLSVIEANADYDQEAVKRIKLYFATDQGLIKVEDNKDMLTENNEKMRIMGVDDINDPILGETYVELSLHFVYRKEGGDTEEQLYLYVEAEDMEILMKKPLEEVIGTTKDHYWRNHYPYCSWADDVDRQDFWTDGIADIVRTPNKILNSFFSQLVENRTLRNFGMKYYDATKEGFTPPSNQPLVAGGWYPVPGKPSDVFELAQIPDLSESLDEMNFIIAMLEKATGATSTQQGAPTERQITLGEVQLALGEAKERIKGMSKFYTPAWKQRGEIFEKLIEAGADQLDAVKIYKKGRTTDNMYTREIAPKDWMTPLGYVVRVWSQDEKNAQDTQSLQKLNALKLNMADNPKVDEIWKRKLAEFAGLQPDEVNAIMEEEKRKREAMATMQAAGGPMTPGQPGQPGPTQPTQPPMMQ